MPVVGNRMTPLDRLVYWITERESIRIKKEAGEPPPWTADPILRAYRFCNVRRMDDKVSRWLLDKWYLPNTGHPNTLVGAAFARFFNLPETLEAISHLVWRDGPPLWERIRKTLAARSDEGWTVFNSAYIICGKKRETKLDTVLDRTLRPLHENWLLSEKHPKYTTHSMYRMWAALTEIPGFGSFMAGQVVADLRWAVTGSWRDRNDWAPLGPGSVRGVNRVLGAASGRGVSEMMGVIERVRDLLPESIGSRLEAMDYQNCLCEYDKYERARLGEGRPKQRYRGAGDESVRGQ